MLDAPRVAQQAGIARAYLKVEGLNPTGSFKDRGMVVAVSKALEGGAQTIICQIGDERFAIHFEIEDLPPASPLLPWKLGSKMAMPKIVK